jgi:hypothetical protein
LPFSAQVFQSISFSVVLLRPPLVLLLHFWKYILHSSVPQLTIVYTPERLTSSVTFIPKCWLTDFPELFSNLRRPIAWWGGKKMATEVCKELSWQDVPHYRSEETWWLIPLDYPTTRILIQLFREYA